jgi:hypothetical protein
MASKIASILYDAKSHFSRVIFSAIFVAGYKIQRYTQASNTTGRYILHRIGNVSVYLVAFYTIHCIGNATMYCVDLSKLHAKV